jgi:hypothetical protein
MVAEEYDRFIQWTGPDTRQKNGYLFGSARFVNYLQCNFIQMPERALSDILVKTTAAQHRFFLEKHVVGRVDTHRFVGFIWLWWLLFGASAPWYPVRFALGLGTRSAFAYRGYLVSIIS